MFILHKMTEGQIIHVDGGNVEWEGGLILKLVNLQNTTRKTSLVYQFLYRFILKTVTTMIGVHSLANQDLFWFHQKFHKL